MSEFKNAAVFSAFLPLVYIGKFSSLAGKVQKLQDKSNQKNPLLSSVETNSFFVLNEVQKFYETKSVPIKWPKEAKLAEDRFIEFTFKHPEIIR